MNSLTGARIRAAPSASELPRFDVVVIGASAGGIKPLKALLGMLPGDFPLPILAVVHLRSDHPSKLPDVLGWRAALRVKWAEHRERLRAGTVYMAPPDQHLLVSADHTAELSRAERVKWWRPAVDTLFKSAAAACSERTIAIVMSGALFDGAEGIAAVGDAGGITIVQDQDSAEVYDMPAAALDLGRADVVMNTEKMADALLLLAASRN